MFLEEDQRLLGEDLEGADLEDGVGYGVEVSSDVLDAVVGNVFDVVLVVGSVARSSCMKVLTESGMSLVLGT